MERNLWTCHNMKSSRYSLLTNSLQNLIVLFGLSPGISFDFYMSSSNMLSNLLSLLSCIVYFVDYLVDSNIELTFWNTTWSVCHILNIQQSIPTKPIAGQYVRLHDNLERLWVYLYQRYCICSYVHLLNEWQDNVSDSRIISGMKCPTLGSV